MTSYKGDIYDFNNVLILYTATTASEDGNYDWPAEIIQISVTVLTWSNSKWCLNDSISFNTYVRPVINPVLTEYCKKITNVSQDMVKDAVDFKTVHKQLDNWLKETFGNDFVFVTDSLAEIGFTVQYQFLTFGITLPIYFKKFINVHHDFQLAQSNGTLKKELEHDQSCQKQEENKSDEDLGKLSNLADMCKHYGFSYTPERYNSWDHSQKLRLVVRAMLNDSVRLDINIVLVCECSERQKKLKLKTCWRNNYRAFTYFAKRVLPLFPRRIAKHDSYKTFSRCRKCHLLLEKCGSDGIHRQFPSELFGKIKFAEVAAINIE